MNVRIAVFLCTSLSVVALLAGCDGGGAETVSADIVSVYPEQIDVATDQELGAVHVSVALSADTTQRVCAASSGTDFPAMYAGKSGPTLWDPTTRWYVTFEPDPDLSIGEHVGSLYVYLSNDPTCERGEGSRTIPYRLSKLYGLAQPEPVTLRVDPETTADELRGSARIDMAGGPQHAWTARSLLSWLIVDTPEGLTGSDVQFHVDPATAASVLGNGSAGAQVEIAGDTEGMTSRSFSVSLQLALPVAQVAMPADQPTGPARRFRVRGTGFTEEAIANGQLAVDGVPGAVFTRLSGLDLAVELPAALPSGYYRLVTPNALGLTPSRAVLRLTAPVETARAVLPGDGANGHMLWDGAGRALLVLEPPITVYAESSNTIRRHALRAGVWTQSSRWVDSVRRLGFTPGGTQLLAASASESGSYLLHPEMLSVLGRFGTYSGLVPEPPSQAPLAVTIDGRAWFGTRDALVTFDVVNGSPRTMMTPSAWTTTSTQPARTIASRDGGRLLVSRPGSGAFLYHDATEHFWRDAFHLNPAGATTFDAISDDGRPRALRRERLRRRLRTPRDAPRAGDPLGRRPSRLHTRVPQRREGGRAGAAHPRLRPHRTGRWRRRPARARHRRSARSRHLRPRGARLRADLQPRGDARRARPLRADRGRRGGGPDPAEPRRALSGP